MTETTPLRRRLPVQKRAEDTVQRILEAGGDAGRGLVPGFEVSPIFNFHVGPGQKIKVRGRAADQSRQEVR